MKTNAWQSLAVSLFAAITMTACAELDPEEALDEETTDETSSAILDVPHYGDTMWVTACDHTSVVANWSGCSTPIAQNSCTYNPPPGWVIVDNHVTVWSSNNGWRANQTLAGGLNLVTQTTLQSAYNSAINLAVQYQDQAIALALGNDYTQHEDLRETYQASHNTAKLTVSARAHGNCFNRMRGWEEDSLEVKLLYIGTNNVDTMLNELRDLYGLWDPILLLNNKGLNPNALINLSAYGPIKVKDAAFTTNNYFLSVQKSDQWWNSYGAEATEWLPIAEGQQIKAGTYSLSTFMARHPEVTLSAGNYYRVKLANGVNGWNDTTRLVKLY